MSAVKNVANNQDDDGCCSTVAALSSNENENDVVRFALTEEQIQEFVHDGVLVVENVLTQEQIHECWNGIRTTFWRNGEIDLDDLSRTGHAFQYLSSTNGSGGVLDLFYDTWKIQHIATNATLFHLTTQLWEAMFCHHNESYDSLSDDNKYKWHPYGSFRPNIGYTYIDRIGFRLPTKLAEQLGNEIQHAEEQKHQQEEQTQQQQHSQNGGKKKKSKKMKSTSIQRSLTPHLDCCPNDLYAPSKQKWRPIQCFVSLTNNLEPNTGGFEAIKPTKGDTQNGIKGFHRTFHQWAKERPPTIIRKKIKKGLGRGRGGDDNDNEETATVIPAPCMGEYTHVRPKEDADVMSRIRHIPVPAGAVVFFDNRIPHANAYRHDGIEPRCVIYTSFLPDTPLNRRYVNTQLYNWRHGKQPTDPWIESKKNHVQEEQHTQQQSSMPANQNDVDDEKKPAEEEKSNDQDQVQDAGSNINIGPSSTGRTFSSTTANNDNDQRWTLFQRRLLGMEPWDDPPS